MSTIELTIKGQVAHLLINRENKHNALTQTMWQDIYDCCIRLKNEIKPRVLVISGAGVKAFSAGADIDELRDIIQDSARLKENNLIVQQAQQELESLPFATVAKINGICVGGGMGIALACDFRICAESSLFAITPSKLGLLYSIEDTKRLVNAVGLSRAKELLYLGNKIDADTALKWSLVMQKVPLKALEETCTELVTQLIEVSGYSISGIKKTLSFLSQTTQHEEKQIRQLFDEAFTQHDFNEGAQAFLQKRKPEFD
jgi:enoyl-CoA hydratase/carnithine racemase